MIHFNCIPLQNNYSLLLKRKNCFLPFVFLWIFPYILIQLVWDCKLSTLRGQTRNFQNYDVFLPMKVVLILANSSDLIQCNIMLYFIWVFTGCQSTCLWVSSIQRVKQGCCQNTHQRERMKSNSDSLQLKLLPFSKCLLFKGRICSQRWRFFSLKSCMLWHGKFPFMSCMLWHGKPLLIR